MANGYPKQTLGVDFNKFARVSVDGYSFNPTANVVFNFRHSNLSFSLIWEGTGIIEYSFNGNTVHGDMESGSLTESLFFNNRNVMGIWFRIKEGPGGPVRVEGWAL